MRKKKKQLIVSALITLTYVLSKCISLESRFTRETKTPSREDMLLVQSIQITDKFGFDKQTSLEKARSSSETVFVSTDPAAFCVNGLGNVLILYATTCTSLHFTH